MAKDTALLQEQELFYGSTDCFGIYQLRDGEELHYHRFQNLDSLEKSGLKVEKGNYELIYTAPLKEGQSLDEIFEEFNLFRPEDFTGHSLSVSDIILLHKDGENHAQYVDRFGFREVPQFLENVRDKTAEKEMVQPYISHYYVVTDLLKRGALEVQRYPDMDEALTAYFTLPNDKRKAFGIQNSRRMPGSLDFIQCLNGIDSRIFDYESVEGWSNPEVLAAVERIHMVLDLHETEIAYQIGEGYFTIQSTSEGYDYNFYDAGYHLLDGGVYDNPDLPITEAMHDILEDESLFFSDCQVTNYEALMDKVEAAEQSILEPEKTTYPPVYRYPFSYADENGEIESYRASKKENIACRDAIEQAIREKFDGMHLQHDAAQQVIERFGQERVFYVLANTVRENEADGRFSYENKAWAHTIPVYEDKDKWSNGNLDFFINSHPVVLNGFIDLAREEALRKEVYRVTPVSDMTEPETSLNNMSRADIEETVLAYAQSRAEEAGYEVQVTAARVYGSRTAGIETPDSDVDVVIEFQGEIREDEFFNLLHEDGLTIGGMTVDINPVTAGKSGTIEEYLARANEYLEEKVKSFREAASDQEKTEVTAEVPGAGHHMEPGEDFGKLCDQLAVDIDRFCENYDPYEYRDAIDDKEENIRSIYGSLQDGDESHIREWMQTVIDEGEPEEDVKAAEELLKRMDDLAVRREKNPLTKVEELEEANYNQIDGILNNTKQKETSGQEEKKLSIMERLERSKERMTQEDGRSGQQAKSTAKKAEMGMD